MTSEGEYSYDDFEQLATNYDMFERLATTLDRPSIGRTVTHAVLLQLVGSSSYELIPGQEVRGDIHLAIISDSTANLSRYLSLVVEIAPQETARLNGTSTSLAGIVGSVSGGTLTPGPIIDESVGLTIIEQFDSARGKSQNAFQQVMDSGQYSFAKANYRDTVDAPGSILIGLTPKYGNFDEYEPVVDQLNLTPSLVSGVDLPIVNFGNGKSSEQTDLDRLPMDLAREYISYAHSVHPGVENIALEEIRNYIRELKSNLDNSGSSFPFGISRLHEALIRFSNAHAKIQLSEQVTQSDAQRAIDLVNDSFTSLGFDPETGEFGSEQGDVISLELEAHEEFLLMLIRSEVDAFEEGVPHEFVLEKAREAGIDERTTIDGLEALKMKGDVYEPRGEIYRPT
ncbi:minichromosome maintenance protein MCM [Haloferax profundi]|uniref:minichromosome maintenance protein MCM n=1 Tax=Haloferax profundi TaxID=1544718 RepID=UPI000B0586BD|nr:minichromosome maintenance protein MCM [Haloferax profundi]